GRNGEEIVHTSVYCPLRETSVPTAECEPCVGFHALHFDVGTRATSVVCDCTPAAAELAAEDVRRTAPPDPTAPLSDVMVTMVVGVMPATDVHDVRALLDHNSINSVPVCDAAGHILGMLTRADILRAEQEARDTEEVCPVSSRGRIEDLEVVLEP